MNRTPIIVDMGVLREKRNMRVGGKRRRVGGKEKLRGKTILLFFFF